MALLDPNKTETLLWSELSKYIKRYLTKVYLFNLQPVVILPHSNDYLDCNVQEMHSIKALLNEM